MTDYLWFVQLPMLNQCFKQIALDVLRNSLAFVFFGKTTSQHVKEVHFVGFRNPRSNIAPGLRRPGKPMDQNYWGSISDSAPGNRLPLKRKTLIESKHRTSFSVYYKVILLECLVEHNRELTSAVV
jgi:hypothetical protein